MATIPESYHGILAHPGVGTLTTNGHDGYPHSTAVWYLFDRDDGVIRFVMQATTQKAKNLQRDSKCAFVLIDPGNSSRAIMIRGDAELSIEEGEYHWAERIVNHYGSSMKNMYNVGAPRLVVTLRPARVNTHG
ncbi:MAG TPA: TIGR03618 family F420-dependent PPOX class oxidoreductase [Thermomicrobiales bacterium]|jgi:PPOX class probable F420-dependent enzyme|nr:TIGR03618 family F420-dependent PPOX class oxidoreductase [Thermomicrobiales bacterium]